MEEKEARKDDDWFESLILYLIGILGTIVYGISPVDFIPDLIPFIGSLDDQGIAGVMAILVWKKLEKLMADEEKTVDDDEIND